MITFISVGSATLLHPHLYPHPAQWDTTDTEIKVPLAENPELSKESLEMVKV